MTVFVAAFGLVLDVQMYRFSKKILYTRFDFC
jgi:hypothetical protein